MVYYIGYYNCDAIRSEDRIVASASENKMGYIKTAIYEACNDPIEIVTPAETRSHRYVKGRKLGIHDRIALKTFSSFSSSFSPLRALGHLWTRFLFAMYLFLNVKPEDHLIVYHSLAYMRVFKFLKKIKKCGLTIEVEEIYADVTGDEELRRKEITYLQIADSYIFITELLRREVNLEKPALISHGTYQTRPDYGFRFDDDRIHVVYAGTFRRAKGGAYTAIAAAEYLDSRYTLEILGRGSEEENAAIEELISDISKKTDCRISYAGFKTGRAFDTYIQACHIGLSTQQADAKFNATSFPSKVLMYMSNGLPVVSVRIPAVETSDVKDYISYYDDPAPEKVAEAIMGVALKDLPNPAYRLAQLHEAFVGGLKLLLKH